MRLLVISHKPVWPDNASPTGYATDGGFPFQMCHISDLFDQTVLLLPVCRTPTTTGTTPLLGHNLCVHPLTAPLSFGWLRKLTYPFWLLKNGITLWRQIADADAVHTPVPGDIGMIGLIMTLAQHKPLFVRHCGTWMLDNTPVQWCLNRLLVRIAGGTTVVLATGGSNMPPSPKKPAIQWIFSTSLTQMEIDTIAPQISWRYGDPLRLVNVARQEPLKNTACTIEALPLIQQHYAHITLDVVGTGSALESLKQLTNKLGLNKTVTFHGQVSHYDVLEILSHSNLFLFPTKSSEGFPKAVHEALACGLPVITTPASVLPYLVGEHSGVIVPRPTPEALAHAVLGLIEDENAFAEKIRNARQTSLEYSLEKWRDGIGEILEAAWTKPLRDQLTNALD